MSVTSVKLRERGAEQWEVVAPTGMPTHDQDEIQSACYETEYGAVSAAYIEQHRRSDEEEVEFAREIAACMQRLGVALDPNAALSRVDLAEINWDVYYSCYDPLDP